MSGLPNERDEVLRGKCEPYPCQVWTIVPKETLIEAAKCGIDASEFNVISAVDDIKRLLRSVIDAIEHPQPGAEHTPKSASGTLWTLKRLLEKEFMRCIAHTTGAAIWLESPPKEYPVPPVALSTPQPSEAPKEARQAPGGDASAAYRAIEEMWHHVAIAAIVVEMHEAEGYYPKVEDDEDEEDGKALESIKSLICYLEREWGACVRLIDDALERLGLA